jgi:flavodoxin/ferredoxin
MKRCLLVYLSLRGTTEKTAFSIAAGLRSAGWQVELCNMASQKPPGTEGYDLLGIGSPAHYFRLPFNVSDYLHDLPGLGGLPVFSFMLYGSHPGETGNLLRRALSGKGGREAGYFHCRGADYYQGYLQEGYLFSPDNPLPEELAAAERFGRKTAAVLSGAEAYSPPPFDPPMELIFRIERSLASRGLVRTIYIRLFKVNRSRCEACGRCMSGCPTGTISADADGRPVWGQNCLMCLYCQMQCPNEAISTPITWKVFRTILGYNIAHSLGDPSIAYARVTHRRGETRREG